MGRNQFDMSDDDLAGMREQSRAAHEARLAVTPEQQQAERDAFLEQARAAGVAEAKARKKAAKEAAAALEEDRRKFEVYAEDIMRRMAEMGLAFIRPAWRHPLFTLSQDNYEAYLATPQWKSIRRRVVKRDGGLCRLCGSRAQCVHHISYEQNVMIGQKDSDLISLCRACHKGLEYDGKRHRDEAEKLALLTAKLGRL